MAVNDRVNRYRFLGSLGLVGSLFISGCASASSQEAIAPTPEVEDQTDARAQMLDPCAKPNLTTVEPGAITFAASAAPAPPFFLTETPSDRSGLESDLAYALAETLGFRPGEVTWEIVPAEQILSGEFTDYDLAIGGYAPDRVDGSPVVFSQPYLQADLVVLSDDDLSADLDAGSPLSWAFSLQGPARSWLVAQGQGIESSSTFTGANQLTRDGAIRRSSDAVVVDEFSARWLVEIAGEEVPMAVVLDLPIAEFAFGLVAGNPMLACIDRALIEMSEVGTLDALRERWLDPQQWSDD